MDFRFWLVLLMRGLPTSHEMWTRALQKRRGMNGILTLHSECGPLPLQDVGYIGHLQDVGYIGHRSGIVFSLPFRIASAYKMVDTSDAVRGVPVPDVV